MSHALALNKLARFLGAVLVLGLTIWYADPGTVYGALAQTRIEFFGIAFGTAVVANILSAVRWAHIARLLGLSAATGPLILSYARGITSNTVLPGATLSGDLLRSYELHHLGNPLSTSVFSVFLDRFSGLWVLCLMSLLGVLALVGFVSHDSTVLPLGSTELAMYCTGLGAIVVLPWLYPLVKPLLRLLLPGLTSVAERWDRANSLQASLNPGIPASICLSLMVQLLSSAALWLCGLAVGLETSYPVMVASAAPIFLLAALPLSFAGFGTREFAAVFVLGFAGVPSGQAVATALLFGLCAVIQGIISAPLFLVRRQSGVLPQKN